jgi:NitT/TauT family transport system substrate-binding protein
MREQMLTTRRRMMAALAMAPLVSSCGGDPGGAASGRVRIGYTNTVSFTSLFIARHERLFAKHGLEAELVLIALNSTMPSVLMGGSIDIAGTSPPVFVQAVDGGLDIVVIAGGSVNDVTKRGAGVVARRGVAIAGPQDFVGKRVGVPGLGAYMHVLFRKWLADKGVDERRVSFVEVPLAQASDVLRAGDVDAVVVGEPFFSRIASAGTGRLVSAYLTEMPDRLFQIYYSSSRRWADRNGDRIVRFRRAIADANALLAADPAGARRILAAATNLPADVVASSILPTVRLDVPASDVAFWIGTLAAQGAVRARSDTTGLIVE